MPFVEKTMFSPLCILGKLVKDQFIVYAIYVSLFLGSLNCSVDLQIILYSSTILLWASLIAQLAKNSSVGPCNAGDPCSIPGTGRSSGEGIGYPPQYSWASLVVPLVKNPPEMWETWVRSVGWKDPLENGKATNSSILAWRTPRTI